MTSITGAQSVITSKIGGTYGTANAVSMGDKMEVESLAFNRSPEELTANPIGSGNVMASDSQQGATTPVITVEKIENYDDSGTALEALFVGQDRVVNMGGGSFMHSLIDTGTINSSFTTMAWQYAAQSVMEAASCVVTKLTHTYENPPNYGKVSIELLANDIIVESTTNSYANLASTTVRDSTRVVAQPTAEFLINGQSGSALVSPTHRYAITSLVSTRTKAQSSPREFKGSSGNGQPIPTGSPPYEATLTVTLKSLEDVTFFRAARAGTEYKASFTITDTTLIGNGNYRMIVRHWPRLKLVTDPEYGLSEAGINPLTLNFKCLVATSNPTGMISTYPYALIQNSTYSGYM